MHAAKQDLEGNASDEASSDRRQGIAGPGHDLATRDSITKVANALPLQHLEQRVSDCLRDVI